MEIKILQARLGEHDDLVAEIAKLTEGSTVGILCSSLRFGEMLERTASDYGSELKLLPPVSLTMEENIRDYLGKTEALLLPLGYEKYCSSVQRECLSQYDGMVILCGYEMDEGSFLYLQERIRKIRRKKAL